MTEISGVCVETSSQSAGKWIFHCVRCLTFKTQSNSDPFGTHKAWELSRLRLHEIHSSIFPLSCLGSKCSRSRIPWQFLLEYCQASLTSTMVSLISLNWSILTSLAGVASLQPPDQPYYTRGVLSRTASSGYSGVDFC